MTTLDTYILENYTLDPEKGTMLSNRVNRFLTFKKGFNGELKAEIAPNGVKHLINVAEVFYTRFVGNVKEGFFVDYRDGNKENIKPNNLFLSKRGLYQSPGGLRIYTEEEEMAIIKGYVEDLEQVIPLSKRFKVAQRTITGILRAHGIRIRTGNDSDIVPYSLNKRYFERVDTQEKAYLLGFLFADGSVSAKSNGITIGINDVEVLNFFVKELALEGKEYYYNPNHEKCITLSFSCREMKEDLLNLGCNPSKTFTLTFPGFEKISKELFRHFIRGYFDGDGSITVTERTKQAHLVSSTIFCNQIKEILQNDFNIKCSKVGSYPPNKKETSEFHICGKENLKRFRSFMYEDSNLSLTRKKIIFDTLI